MLGCLATQLSGIAIKLWNEESPAQAGASHADDNRTCDADELGGDCSLRARRRRETSRRYPSLCQRAKNSVPLDDSPSAAFRLTLAACGAVRVSASSA